MAGDKKYTAESGTTYVLRNDSVYDWYNNIGAAGQILLRPNSGGPTGVYYPIENRDDPFNFEKPLSLEYVDRHVKNIQEGLDKNGFIAPPSLWDYFRNWLGPRIVKLGEWITVHLNGGRFNYNGRAKKHGEVLNYSNLFK